MQSSGKGPTSPPTARIWVTANWSPDGAAKKRTLSLNAAERGVFSSTPCRLAFCTQFLEDKTHHGWVVLTCEGT